MHTPQVYLASSSPRRRELLAQIGVRYKVVKISVDEAWDGSETPEAHVRRLAMEKARAGWRSVEDAGVPVLGADTVVVLDGQVLGKPRDRTHGVEMLQRLAGRSHQVYTGVALVSAARQASRVSVTTVTFGAIDAAQCAAYWASGEPHDKAGAYAVQGLAAAFIARLEGSYSGVMGLPLFETAQLLREFGVEVLSA